MKIGILSDLHVDHYNENYIYDTNIDVLMIAGDTSGSVFITKQVIEALAEHHKEIIFIDGNHEHYDSGNVHDNMKEFEKISKNNISYLNGTNKILFGSTAFIGCCGWYDFQSSHYDFATCKQAFSKFMNDAYIKFTSTPEELAIQQSANLKKLVNDMQNDEMIENIIVMTHSVPVEGGLIYQENDKIWNMLNGAFANISMKNVINADTKHKIKSWVFGHTHLKWDFEENGIRFICNPRGYPKEKWNRPYDIKIIEI